MNKNPDIDLIQLAVARLPFLLKPLGLDLRLETGSLAPLRTSHSGPDLKGQLLLDGKSVSLAMLVRGRLSEQVINEATVAAEKDGTTMMIVVPNLRPAAQQRLRALGLNFADLTGTISLKAPGIRIEVQGTEKVPSNGVRPRKQQINPFSKKASIVPRTLCEFFGKRLSLSAIANITSLSRGWISGVLAELAERGYATVDKEGATLSNPVLMLRDWINEYKWTQNTSQQFVTPFQHDEITGELQKTFDKLKIRWALTLSAAAHQRLNQSAYDGVVHAYAFTDNQETLRSALNRLLAEPVSDGGNLVLFSPPYYGLATFIDAHKSEQATVVSDVQLLLDLAHFPVRGAELAETLVRSRLAKQFELTSAESRHLIQAFS